MRPDRIIGGTVGECGIQESRLPYNSRHSHGRLGLQCCLEMAERAKLLQEDRGSVVAMKGCHLTVLQMEDVAAGNVDPLAGRSKCSAGQVQIAQVGTLERELDDNDIVARHIYVEQLTVHVGEGRSVGIYRNVDFLLVVLPACRHIIEIAVFGKQGDKFRGVAIGPFGYGVKLTNDGFVGLHDVGSLSSGEPAIAGSLLRSDLDLAAIDEELDAVDEAGVIRGEKEHRLGDLLGLADAACRDQARKIVFRA